MWLLLLALVALGYLSWEQARLRRSQEAIPLRIAVAGTRGKSTVVRLLSSVLRESGRRVVAKTTGSLASVVMPDGRVHHLRRRGPPSILEQKRLVYQAREVGADCLVAEVMSIHPENHQVESQRILRPQVVVVTNVGLDHTDAMGLSRDQIASVLAECLTRGSDVFVPDSELLAPLEAMARRQRATIRPVRARSTSAPDLSPLHFAQNLDLVVAVAQHLGIGEQAIGRGLAAAQLDVGQLGIWRYPIPRPGDASGPSAHVFAVSAFAANDPRSSREAVSKALSVLPSRPRVVGLLCLRSDRGDRTQQWVAALRGETHRRFDRLFVVGRHAPAVQRSLGWGHVVAASRPAAVMATLAGEMVDGDALVGLGNFQGLGSGLVELWKDKGEAYGA